MPINQQPKVDVDEIVKQFSNYITKGLDYRKRAAEIYYRAVTTNKIDPQLFKSLPIMAHWKKGQWSTLLLVGSGALAPECLDCTTMKLPRIMLAHSLSVDTQREILKKGLKYYDVQLGKTVVCPGVKVTSVLIHQVYKEDGTFRTNDEQRAIWLARRMSTSVKLRDNKDGLYVNKVFVPKGEIASIIEKGRWWTAAQLRNMAAKL